MSKRASARLWMALAILACVALYLIGNDRVPLWDRDEPWYAQCSWQMLRSGDWVVPKYLDGSLRAEKPPLIYWLQMVPMSLLGPTEFAARLVSVTGMTALLLMLGIVLFRNVGPSRAVWTVFILGTSALTIAAAKMCLTDAVLLLLITGAQLCSLAIYRGRGSWPIILLMWVLLGLGGLLKGPIALVAPVTTMVLLLLFEAPRVIRFFREPKEIIQRRVTHVAVSFGVGMLIMAAIIAPWYLLIWHRSPEWLREVYSTAKQHVMTPIDGHGGPPGTNLLWIWGTFFPWSLLLPTAVAMAWRNRHLPVVRFAVAAVLGPWIVHELMTTKLPHYVLPAFPFLAFLTADGLVRCTRGQYQDLVKPVFVRVVAVWAVLVGLFGSVTWLAATRVDGAIQFASPFKIDWPVQLGLGLPLASLPWGAMIALSVTGFLFTFGVYACFRARRVAYAGVALGAGMILFIGLFYGWYLPKARFLQLSPQAADILRRDGAGAPQVRPDGVLTLIYGRTGYQEPSLVFYQAGKLRQERTDDYLQVVRPERWASWMVLTNEIWDRTPESIRQQIQIVGSARGLNYAGGGKVIDLMVVKRK